MQFILARCMKTFCDNALFLLSPLHFFNASSCNALPYEKDNFHGTFSKLFISFKISVASKLDKPPDRKTIPGTSSGTHSFKHLIVSSADVFIFNFLD